MSNAFAQLCVWVVWVLMARRVGRWMIGINFFSIAIIHYDLNAICCRIVNTIDKLSGREMGSVSEGVAAYDDLLYVLDDGGDCCLLLLLTLWVLTTCARRDRYEFCANIEGVFIM